MIKRLTLLLLLACSLPAATYTVKAGGDGNFTTIQACSNVAVAGDVCRVYVGSYSGWAQSTNGASGNPILFAANSGDTVTINSAIDLSSRNYITIGGPTATEGFQITGGITFSGNNNIIVQNNVITHASSRCMSGSILKANASSYMYFLNNYVGPCNNGAGDAIYVQGHHWLFEGNTFTRVTNGIQLNGSYHVIRNNHFGPLVLGEAGSVHPDAIEHSCANDYALKHILYERNTTQEWRGPHAHAFLLRNTDNSGDCTNPELVVIRLSRFMNVGSGFSVTQSNMPGVRVYNNSLSRLQVDVSPKERADVSWYDASPYGRAYNNIIANDVRADSPWCLDVGIDSATGFSEGYNLCYVSGYGGSWSTSSFGEYAASDIFNQDPLYVSATDDLNLQAGSPARGAGGPLTSVAASDSGSGTSLIVDDAGYFSDGYGLTGVQADWIAVGTVSNTAQINSINHATNTITLTSGITRQDSDPVWLYKDSDGTVILVGSAPDIGAYEYTDAEDTADPVVTISSPTSGSTYSVNTASFNISGTASDNVGVSSVAWANDRGGSGAATGTTTWSVTGITLELGANVLTITATDAAANEGTDTLTVTYSVGGASRTAGGRIAGGRVQ